MATERDSSSRESSIFEPPDYEISYGEDHTLQWDPPAGSKELAVALSYHFPMGDLESKMRAATKGFLKAEAKRYPERLRGTHCRSSHHQFSEANVLKTSLQQSKVMNASSRSNNNSPIKIPIESEHQDPGRTPPTTDVEASPGLHQELEFVSWKPEILGFKKTAPKRRYEKKEREKVAANRGYACEEHRRRKMKCDPGKCLNNKQNLKNAWESLSGDRRKAETTSGPTSGAQLASNYNDLGREFGVPADTLSNRDQHINSPYISEQGTFTSPSNSRWSADRNDTIQPSLLSFKTIWNQPVDTTATIGAKDQLEKVEENDAICVQVADQASESIISLVDSGITSPDLVNVHSSFLTDSEPGWLLDDFGFRDDVLLHHENDDEFGLAFFRHLLPAPAFNPVWSQKWNSAPHVGETCANIMTEPLEGVENENGTKHDEHINHNPTPNPALRMAKRRNLAASRKDDWSDITDPEERRRVQNRIAQRKFRDKAKEEKERQDREGENRVHAGHSYQPLDPNEMGTDKELLGLPWGSMSMKHVVKKGKSREEESRRGSKTNEDRSHYVSEPVYEDTDAYYEEGDRAYYDYGTGSLDLCHNRFASKTASRDKTASDGETEDDGQDPRASDGDQLADRLKFLEISNMEIKHEEL